MSNISEFTRNRLLPYVAGEILSQLAQKGPVNIPVWGSGGIQGEMWIFYGPEKSRKTIDLLMNGQGVKLYTNDTTAEIQITEQDMSKVTALVAHFLESVVDPAMAKNNTPKKEKPFSPHIGDYGPRGRRR